MTPAAAQPRSFSVRLRHAEGRGARIVEEASFEAAAVAYAEDLCLPVADGDEVSVIVRDAESGQEHCFTVDLATGETEACG